jgi:hypothetical protein
MLQMLNFQLTNHTHMARIHLFEFEDQPWFPAFLRNYVTDFLQFLSNKAKLYKPVVPVLKEALMASKTSRIVDLGSGGGGGLLWLNSEMKKVTPDFRITLTDFFPNIPAFEYMRNKADNIEFIRSSIDARSVPAELSGLRTQFLSFHHFNPDDAILILQNAVDTNRSIAIFEGQERSAASLVAVVFSPLTVLFITPFIRPFSVGRIFFTYLVPIVPLTVLWDGIVSSLRTYSVAEMKSLVSQVVGGDQFDWKIERIRSGPGVLLYLAGTPKIVK